MLKTVATGGGSGGTVTNIQTGTGLTGGPITSNGTISIANTTVTAGTYGNASTVSQVTINAQGQVTNAVNVAISIANSAVTGLGTMATQNANAVVITGGNATLTALTTSTVQATNSGGLALKNSAGSTQMSMGGGGGDNISLNVSTNLNGANAQIDISPTGTGHVHINPAGSGSVEINPNVAGTINNMVIGGSTPAAGTFTNLASANVSITGGTINVQAANLISTTTANATFATSSLPLVPAGYIQVKLNGTVVKVPYYAV